MNWNMTDPVTLRAGYARSNESFESGNPTDPFGGFSANHVFAEFSWEIDENVAIDFTFDYERRNSNATLKSYDIGMSYRW